jgi:hypothetical protein
MLDPSWMVITHSPKEGHLRLVLVFLLLLLDFVVVVVLLLLVFALDNSNYTRGCY